MADNTLATSITGHRAIVTGGARGFEEAAAAEHAVALLRSAARELGNGT